MIVGDRPPKSCRGNKCTRSRRAVIIIIFFFENRLTTEIAWPHSRSLESVPVRFSRLGRGRWRKQETLGNTFSDTEIQSHQFSKSKITNRNVFNNLSTPWKLAWFTRHWFLSPTLLRPSVHATEIYKIGRQFYLKSTLLRKRFEIFVHNLSV